MQALSFLLIITSLVGALAAPTPDTKALSKRSFKVPVRSRHSSIRSPPDELKRTFAKYGWKLNLTEPEAAPIHSKRDIVYITLTPSVVTVYITASAAAEPSSGTTITGHSTDISVTPSPLRSSATKSSSSTIVSAPSTSSTIAPSAASTSSASTTTSSSTAAASGDGDGEVIATPETNDSEYLAPVTIGGDQLFDLDFDTGSADLWVFSTLQSSSEIGSHSTYDSTKSSTYTSAQGASWKISYGDTSSASGIVGFDTVTLGDLTVPQQAIELATEVSSQFSQDASSDGLLGLAFSSINTISPNPQKTWFANILPDLAAPLFTADLADSAPGTYEFGAIDTTKYSGDLQYATVDSSNGFWQFASTSFSISTTTHACAICSPAIADTGTSLMLVDDDVASAYYASVTGAAYNPVQGGYVYDCDATLPDFGVAVGENIVTLKGEGLTYMKLSSGQCYGGIQPNQGAGWQIYGDVFFKQLFAVFEAREEGARFGVARKA